MVTIRTLYREAHDDSIFVCGVVAVKSTLVPFKLQNFALRKGPAGFARGRGEPMYSACCLQVDPLHDMYLLFHPRYPVSPTPPYTYCMYPFEAVQ